MKIRLLITGLFLFLFLPLFSQEEKAAEMIQQKIEELSENSENQYDYSELFEILMNFYQNPINLNSTTADELRLLPFLNDIQINQILEHIAKNGQMLSVYELKDVQGMNLETIYNILPFIKVQTVEKKQKLEFGKLLKYGKNEVFFRESRVLQQQLGFEPASDSILQQNPNARYLGDANHLYLKYRYQYRNRISLGFTADKDAGEEFFTGSNKSGFDFYTFHLYFAEFGKLKKLAVGDYHLEFGQGLTLCTGLNFGKSSSSISAQKQAAGLRANTSANENLFLRGTAATVEVIKNLEFTLFYSKKGLDASIQQADTMSQEDYIFTALQESGYHRTPSELEKKNAISIQMFGYHVNYKRKGWIFGSTYYHYGFDKTFVKDLSPYQYFDFQGNTNDVAGLDFRHSNTIYSLFGEMSMSKNGAMAGLAGAMFNLNSRLQLSLVYRNFSKDYQSFYSAAFSESGKTQNEKGLYLGSQVQIDSKDNVVFYYDIFKFPWLKYRTDAPSNGDDFSLQWNRNETRYLTYYLRFKTEQKQMNSSLADAGLKSLIQYRKTGLRIALNYSLNKQIRLKSCVETATYKTEEKPQSQGFVMYQDFKYKFNSLPLDLSFRYAVFNTDDYDSRIYAYEDNVLYAFSVPAYYYKGQRFYILASYEIGKNIDLWLRYSLSIYDNKTVISSGLDEINGNKKSEIIAQLRWKI